MPRLFFTVMVLGFIGVLAYVIYRLVKAKLDRFTSQNPTNTPQSIDIMIGQVKTKIKFAQLEVESGIEGAEENLKKYKEDLQKLKELQSKIN